MPKKKLSDIVFIRVSPPDQKKDLSKEDLSRIIVKRLGLKRKEGRADHAKLLLEFIKYRKDNIPLEFENISKILGVSQSQTYEELRKWRTMGLVEFVRIPVGNDFSKGYMLTGNTVNRLLDKVESNTKSFLRKTRRIAKDFDDLLMLDIARRDRSIGTGTIGNSDDENDTPDDGDEDDSEDGDDDESGENDESEEENEKISDVSDKGDENGYGSDEKAGKNRENSEKENIDDEEDDEEDSTEDK